jgi:hypothetical protein
MCLCGELVAVLAVSARTVVSVEMCVGKEGRNRQGAAAWVVTRVYLMQGPKYFERKSEGRRKGNTVLLWTDVTVSCKTCLTEEVTV